MAASSRHRIYVAGADTSGKIGYWGGSSWSLVTIPDSVFTAVGGTFPLNSQTDTSQFWNVWGVSPTDVWFTTDAMVVHYKDGSFTLYPDPEESYPNTIGIWGSGANDVYFGNGTSGTTGLWHWNGTTVAAATGWPRYKVYRQHTLHGSSSSNVWVAMGGQFTYYNGTAWTEDTGLTIVTDPYCTWVVSSTEVYMGTEEGHLYSYNGTTLTEITHPLAGASLGFSQFWAFSSTDIYVVGWRAAGAASRSFVFHYDGLTWTDVTPDTEPITGEGYYCCYGVEDNDTGDKTLYIGTWNGYVVSYDCNSTWENLGSPGSVVDGGGWWDGIWAYSVPVYDPVTTIGSQGMSFDLTSSQYLIRPRNRGRGYSLTQDDGYAPIHYWNQFDEHASLVSLTRLRGEKNWELKRRTIDAMTNLANSTYQGLVNGITRELGLSTYNALSIVPKLGNNGNFIAPDPYIKFDGAFLYLYSDYTNDVQEFKIDRYEPGGNYEYLGWLIDFINSGTYFTANIYPGIDRYERSMTILSQSNRGLVTNERVPESTKFKLKNDYLVRGSVFFTNRDVFRTEMVNEDDVTAKGRYYIDYSKGAITVYTIATNAGTVRYQYVKYPFYAKASPVVLCDINSQNFKAKMFDQVLLEDGTYENGIPTELGIDIINEILSVTPLYWGI